jgi:hypothetical protein
MNAKEIANKLEGYYLAFFNYEKPKCDCNTLLKVKKIKHYREYTRYSIFSLFPKFTMFNGAELILICPACKREYDSVADKRGRITRGEIRL